jgi:hypothetical protein
MSHALNPENHSSPSHAGMHASNHHASAQGDTLRMASSSYAATEQAVKSLIQDAPPNPAWEALAKSLKESLARELLTRLDKLCTDHALGAALCDRNKVAEHVEVMIDAYGIAARFSDAFITSYQQKLERFCESAQPPVSKADYTRIRTLPSHDLCRNFGTSPEEALEWFNTRVFSGSNKVKPTL